jgi:hypothetical protein
VLCEGSRGGRRRGGEKEGRGNGAQQGERGRSDCWWKGSRGLGDRRMRWKEEARRGGTDVMERSCAVARGKDINTVLRI